MIFAAISCHIFDAMTQAKRTTGDTDPKIEEEIEEFEEEEEKDLEELLASFDIDEHNLGIGPYLKWKKN